LVFAPNSRGRTPLFSAVDSNSAAIISALLKQATKCINHRDHNGETALILACKHCCFTAVLELLSYHDIDVNIMDKDGISAMYYLLKKYLVYHVDEDHIHFNDFKQVLELMHVKHPSAFYYINPSGGNLFHELAAHRYPELENKKLFLRSIYHMVNDYDNTGKTPLLTASKNCNSHVIDFIGWIPFADFSLKDLINGKSALHYLCENMICPNYLESFLHDYKINVNAIDNNGDTAVHSYCKLIDVSKQFRKPENCIKIINNVLNQNIFLSIKKNHSGEIISDILNSKIDEAKGYHLPVTIQTIKNCYEIIKDFEKKARWLIFQYFMLNAADENTPLATI
jgi:ankyrin repeat protein